MLSCQKFDISNCAHSLALERIPLCSLDWHKNTLLSIFLLRCMMCLLGLNTLATGDTSSRRNRNAAKLNHQWSDRFYTEVQPDQKQTQSKPETKEIWWEDQWSLEVEFKMKRYCGVWIYRMRIDRWIMNHSQLFIIEDTEQLLDQSVTWQGLVVDNAGEVTLALQQFLPGSVQQWITHAIDSCWGAHAGCRQIHTLVRSVLATSTWKCQANMNGPWVEMRG